MTPKMVDTAALLNCDAQKYSAAEFAEFCREHKIKPLDKGSTTFPVVTEFARPKSIPVKTFEQASYVAS